jgi:hypothetical protein
MAGENEVRHLIWAIVSGTVFTIKTMLSPSQSQGSPPLQKHCAAWSCSGIPSPKSFDALSHGSGCRPNAEPAFHSARLMEPLDASGSGVSAIRLPLTRDRDTVQSDAVC